MCRGINGQIDKYLSRNASLSRPKNPADGRRLNVTVTGYFGVQRERPRARSRAAKMKRERASPGRPATQPDAPLSEVRAKRVLGNNLKKKSAFPLIMRLAQLLKFQTAAYLAPRIWFVFKLSNLRHASREDHFLFDREMRPSATHLPSCHSEMRNIRVHPCRANNHYCSVTVLHENNLHQRKSSERSARRNVRHFKAV